MVLSILTSTLASVALLGILTAVGYPAHFLVSHLGLWRRPSVGASWLFGFSMISAGAWIAFSMGVKLGIAYRVLLIAAGAIIGLQILVARRWPTLRDGRTAWRAAGPDVVTFCACAATYVALVDSKLTPNDLGWPTIFNADIFVYLRASGYLSMFPGGTSSVGQMILPDFIEHDVFGTFSLLTFIRFVLHTPIEHLALVPMGMAIGMVGMSIGRCGRVLFGMGLAMSILLAILTVTGPLFQYIVLNYFLSQTIFVSLLLLISLWLVEQWPGGPRAGLAAALVFSAASVSLLLCYDVWLLQFIAVEASLVAAIRLLQPAERCRDRVSSAVLAALSSAALASGCAAAVSPTRFAGVVDKLVNLSVPNVNGWPLPFIDLDLLLGLPIGWQDLSPPKVSVAGSVLGFVLLLTAIGAAVVRIDRGPHSMGRRMILGLFCLTTAAYLVVWMRFGEAYQQWKFASTLPLGFGFVAVATVVHLLRLDAPPVRAKAASVAAGAFLLICITSNVSIARGDLMATLAHIPIALRDLAIADEAPGDKPIYVDVADFQVRMAALAMIDRKPVTFSGVSQFGPGTDTPPDRPHLTYRAACPKGNERTSYALSALGPDALTPLRVGDRVPLSQDVASCLSLKGFAHPEPWGRRSDGHHATIRFDCACDIGTDGIEIVLKAGAPNLPDLPSPQVANIAADGAAPLEFSLDPSGFRDMVIPVRSKPSKGSEIDLEIDLPGAMPRPAADPANSPLFALSLVSLEVRRRGEGS